MSGWYFWHPEAQYFGVGKIERDQVEDYARRKGMDVAEAERWLAPNLNYDAARQGASALGRNQERPRNRRCRPSEISSPTSDVHVLDGAMGTMLYSRGVFVNVCYDELNLSQPGLVQEVHEAYVRAGAEILETNTFGANPVKLSGFGLDDGPKTSTAPPRPSRSARRTAGRAWWVPSARSASGSSPGDRPRETKRSASSAARCAACGGWSGRIHPGDLQRPGRARMPPLAVAPSPTSRSSPR